MTSLIKKSALAGLSLLAFGAVASADDAAALPAPDNSVCTDQPSAMTFRENDELIQQILLLGTIQDALNNVENKWEIKNDTYTVGGAADLDPADQTLGHTFMNMVVAKNGEQVDSIYGMFDNAAGTLCGVSEETFKAYKPQPAPAP